MESWDNLILQWINCLLIGTGDCVQSIEELQDGKKYLKLINKVKSFKQKIDNDEVSEKEIVIQFLEDEYPNFVLGTKTKTVERLCIALLILSRLSLEPVFHKSLCTNLNLDIQIMIKSILESVYPLGKKVTIEDLYQTFSLLDKSSTESFSTKPKYLLENFLNSPVTRSVHSDSKIHEQTKQIRHLQADLETVRYEKCELIEDIKIQKKQIDDLHKKLQETLLELKNLRQDSLKSNDFNGSYEPTTPKSLELSYEKELQSLENYVAELQSDNFKLQDEKTNLLDELKICRNKYNSIEEKSSKHEEMIESLLFQIEGKDNELAELKAKYEELCLYLKEKSKPLFINQSFDVDDKVVLENSMNNSETLSSVIDIQLQDAKREIIEAQNKYKRINSLLTIIIEEYIKLKKTVQMLFNDNAKIKAANEEKYTIINEQLQHILNKKKLEKESQLQTYNELDLSEIKQNITQILQGDSEKMKSLLLNFLNQFNKSKGVKKLNNYINFAKGDQNNSIMYSEYSNTVKSLEKYQGDKSINIIDKNRIVFKFYDILWQETWRKNLVIFFKTLLENNITSGNITNNTTDHEKVMVKYHMIDTMLEKNLIKCLQDLYNKNEANKASLITKEDLETIRLDWILLYNNIKDTLKIYKVILLLEKKWNIVSKSLGNYENYISDDVRELLGKKDEIDNEFNKIFVMNSKILFFGFITATQLTTKINKSKNEEITLENINYSMLERKNSEDILTHSKCIEKIVNIKKSINDFENMIKSIHAKLAIKIEWADVSVQTEWIETQPTVETEYADICIQTENPEELLEIEPIVKNDYINVSLQTNSYTNPLETDIEIRTEYVNVSLQTEDLRESMNVSLQTEEPTEFLELVPIKAIKYANVSLQTDNIIDEPKPTIKSKCADISMQTEDMLGFIKSEPVEKIECIDVSLQTETIIKAEIHPAVKTEYTNTSLQTDNLTEFTNVSLQTSILEPIEIQIPVTCTNISMQTYNSVEYPETKSIIKTESINVSVQTENMQITEDADIKDKISREKEILRHQTEESRESILNKTAKNSRSILESEEVQNYVKELHEKYEIKLEKMKEKMKSVFNNQVIALKKEQESGFTMKKLKALEEQLEQQCHNHSEELKKYKKHVSELSTQLWEVGDKLLIEKQRKEEIIQKYKDLKTKLDIMEAHNSKISKHEPKIHDHKVLKAEVERQPLQQLEISSVSKMQNVRNFQVMGNAFRTEDEEGELFDTTYNLSELQRSQNIPPPNDLDRLSILQSRNAKCKPHLKSSYAAEMQSYPLPVTEDEIKTGPPEGSASEEVFNDSLSQSLLTGKKVKRRDRTRNGSETSRRSTRRFSNIFRKPRLSLDHK
ncbi:uncharacterized protein LOC131666691 [Phymastichus coffea]|uniref:uncharacterized protein LOC131666691 n=1 Tax=Phymastichus coffea TaxID=108790 RepID=UPI00273ADEFD|nr:uncharacterized protein LOC131666691 [Phymastichus coffea]